MNLRTKILLGIVLALVATFALVAVFSFLSMEKSSLALEEREVTMIATRAASSLATDKQNLESETRDYAAWSDTYRFAEGQYPAWIETNTGGDFFERFGIDGIIVLNTTGDTLLARGYDRENKEVTTLPPDMVSAIRQLGFSEEILSTRNATYRALETTDGLVIVASHPVLTDTFEGPPAGSLHLIRKMNAHYLAGLSARTGATVEIIPASRLAGPGGIGELLTSAGGDIPVIVVPDDSGQVTGYTRLQNLQVPGTYYLRVSESRTTYNEGRTTMMRFLLTIIGAGIFIIAFVLLFVDRVVLSRLNAIISTVRRNTSDGGDTDTNTGSNHDELARLALEIDPVFTRLAESRIQLQQSEERYRMLAESAQDFIYIIDSSDQVTYINRFAARAVGKNPVDLIGRPRSELFPQAENERQAGNVRKVFATGEILKIESNLPLPGGERWADTLLVPLRDRNGTITGVMGITRDITQRKVIEDSLAQTNKKLNLLSSITRHDILNQLTALRTYLVLSLDYTRDADLLEIIHKEQAIAAVINQQITFTRDYQQLGVNTPSWQNLEETIQGSLGSLPARGVMVLNSCTGLEIYADPMLGKVFFNLLDNALRYGGEELSRISISATEENGGLTILVEDNGNGVIPENKERIFERGFGQNTGFGLFLSREILGITGMTITETGTFGRGARFEIHAPKGIFRFSDTPGKR